MHSQGEEMSISFYDLTVGSYVQTVESTVSLLRKGSEHCEAQGLALDEVVATRLHPDMANFHFQVTSITHHSLGAVNGFKSGEFRPPRYDDCDYAALQSMTQATLDELKAQSREEIESLAAGNVTFKMGSNEIPFTALNFALSFSLPNFYFHAATAYDVLRMKGVPIGKMDFLGALSAGR